MNDMIDLISSRIETSSESQLRQEIASLAAALRSSAGRGNRRLVAQSEEAVRLNPAGAFSFDSSNSATLTVNGQSWRAGCFETVSIGDLKDRARRAGARATTARARLWVLDGASPVTDIGALQATTGNALFQVASQFNCLESPGSHVTDVADYFFDPTQGPRASISAFPGTLLRHYRAPADGKYFVQQTDGPQIDLLADACGARVSRNGYFTGQGLAHPRSTVAALEANFDKIQVGVHDDVQVMLGYNWDGAVEDSEHRRIAQVFTSTVSGGGYGGQRNLGEFFQPASRQLLRAAYLGTILAAVCLGRQRVVLTLIGGGVFQNPISLIWEAIAWALDEVQPFLMDSIDVVVNGYNLGSLLNLDKVIVPAVRGRGGAVLLFDGSGLTAIRR